MTKTHIRKGFTLLEVLLVIALMGILFAILLVAINPTRQLAQSRNLVRQADINEIYEALEYYRISQKNYPAGITETKTDICDTGTEQVGGVTNCSGKVDLRVLVPKYLLSIPTDPSGGAYQVYINPNNSIIGVEATGVELAQSLAVNPISSTPTPTPTPTPAPTIVQNGLVLHLDAGNTSSYPGTGTTWTDLSGNGNNLTAINSPTWNSSGYFSTGGTGYFSGSGTASIPIGNSNYTMMAWVRQNSSWGSRRGIISIGGFGSPNVSNALRTADNTNVGNFLHWWYDNDLSVANNNAGLSVGTWFMVTAQFDGTNRRVWANTTNVGSNTPGSSHNVLTTAVMVGATPDGNSFFQGDVAHALIYNRALTTEEIQQNFNATRGRFGL